MKYEVGNKVRVKTNLKVDKKYGDYCFTRDMGQYKGQIVTIANAYDEYYDEYYYIKEDDEIFAWTDEMFEPAITNFDKCKEELKIEDTEEGQPFCNTIHRVRKEKNCNGISCDECREWLKQPYTEPKEILDKQEKNYLSAVIRPFRDRNIVIAKKFNRVGTYIKIMVDDEAVLLPYFEKDKMYKGMKVDKEYTLEELGL